MIEFTFDLGPLHVRFATTPAEDETDDDSDGYYVEVTSDTERVDYPLDEVDTIGFRPTRSTNG